MADCQSFCFVNGEQLANKWDECNRCMVLVVLSESVRCHVTANPHPHRIDHGRWYQQRLYSQRDQHIRPDNR